MARNILASVLVIGVAATMLGAGAMALFSDTETVGVHDIQAGTLNLQVYQGKNVEDPCTIHITIDKIKPMYAFARFLKCTIKNTGTLRGKLSIEISDIGNYENGMEEAEWNDPVNPDITGDVGELGAYLIVRMEFGGDKFLDWPALNDLSGSTIVPPNNVLEPGETETFQIWYWLPLDTGNIVQSDSVEFDIIFHLVQE